MKHCILFIGIFLCSVCSDCVATTSGRPYYTPDDSITVTRLLSAAEVQSEPCLPLYFARQFLGKPYVPYTLELFPDNEQLIVNTRELDCTTFVETVTALTLCAQQNRTSFADYCATLQRIRYRRGKIDRYPSRLHYFSDWIDDKPQMNIVAEQQAPNPPFETVQQLKINYMSKHLNSYVSLKRHAEYLQEIAKMEQSLTGRRYRYIPKAKVMDIEAMRQTIKDGDIVAITSSKPGLDIAHLGFALWQKDGIHLICASMIYKKVVIDPMTLSQYLSKNPSHTGIRVVRIRH